MRGQLVSLLLALALAGCDCGNNTVRARPSLTLSPASIDFGSVIAGQGATATLTLTNDGAAPLTLDAVGIVDDARKVFAAGDAPSTLEPGASTQLQLAYAAPAQPGADGATLSISSDAENGHEQRVALVGRSVAACPEEKSPCGGACVKLSDDDLNCGACGKACSATERCTDGKCACAPKSCADLGKACGAWPDGCGGTVTCPACGSGKTCDASGQCVCAPKSCADLGKACGAWPDGCGGTVTCQACGSGSTCDASGQCACVKKKCTDVGATCGPVPDGCGGMLQCGSCNLPETCGGAGLSNRCGVPPVPGFCSGKWCWENPRPFGLTLHDVWPVSKTDVWFGGDQGSLVHWDGSAFKLHELARDDSVNVLWGAAGNDLWALGGYDVFFHWDGGAWTSVAGPKSGLDVFAAIGFSSTDLFGVGQYSDAVKWDGSSWSTWSAPNGSWSAYGLWGTGPSNLWAVGPNGATQHWTGATWTTVSNPLAGGGYANTLYGVHGTGPSDVWAVGAKGSQGAALHYGGSSWTSSNTPALYQSVWADGAGTVWAAGEGIGRSQAGGAFAVVASPSDGGLVRVRGRAADDVWSVGTGGQVLHWNGAAWNRLSEGVTADLTGVWGASANDIWAVGVGGTIVHFSGTVWTRVTSPTTNILRSVWGASATDIWAVGDAATLLHYDGTSWAKQQPSPSPASLRSVAGRGANDVWAVGDAGEVLHKDASGWSKVTTPFSGTNRTLTAVWAGASEIWVAGVGTDVARFDGTTWKIEALPAGVTQLDCFTGTESDLWLGGYSALLHWDGSSFTQATASLPGEVFALWGGGNDVYGFTGSGGALHYTNGAWSAIADPAPIFESYYGAWAAPGGPLHVVGTNGMVLRFTP